jgi:hypothetical protein
VYTSAVSTIRSTLLLSRRGTILYSDRSPHGYEWEVIGEDDGPFVFRTVSAGVATGQIQAGCEQLTD